jgi:hypothetical protein
MTAPYEIFPVTMTDEQIYQAAKAEWLGILAQLWIAIGKPIEQDRLNIYAAQLEDVPMGLLEKAIDRLLKEHIYSNVPNVGVIWEILRKELGDPYDLKQAIADWPDCVPWIHLEEK